MDARERGNATHEEESDDGAKGAARTLEVATVDDLGELRVDKVQVDEAAHADNEPERSEGRDDGEELTEEGDELGKDEAGEPDSEDNGEPCALGLPGPAGRESVSRQIEKKTEQGYNSLGGEERRVAEERSVQVLSTDVGGDYRWEIR